MTDFESQRGQLQQRVTLIDELRRGQTAPVHIIDQISRSLPDLTWLTNVKQDGYDVTIEGHCTSLTELSDFVGNLEATRYFRRPVEIVIERSRERTRTPRPSLIRFMIKGSFQMAGIEQRAVAPAATAEGGPLVSLSLSRLSWQVQLVVFVVLSAAAAGAYYYYLDLPAQAANRRARA